MYMATLRLSSNSMKPSLSSPGILKCFHSQHPPCRPIHYRMTMLYYVSFFNTYVSPCTKLLGPWNWRLSYSAQDVPYLPGQAQRRYLNDYQWLIFLLPSEQLPLVFTVAMHFVVLTSQMRMVLSPDAVTKRSGLLGCQQSWSTLSPCPR